MIKTDVLVIGAGPVGLFAVHQLGIIGLKAEVVDNLDKVGGQCIELYPDKPIYDIPAIPECTGESLTKNLLEQIKPFKTNFHLNQRVEKISKEKDGWRVTTNKKTEFLAPNVIIAGGVGSFEPRKFLVKGADIFENKGVFYSIKDKNFFKNKKVCIFGGGDSALDWAIEMSKFSEVVLVHRRNEFRGTKNSADIARKLEKEGKIKIKTPFQIDSIEGQNKISSITIKDDNGKSEKITTDFVLGFFGLIMKLGPIAEWGLNLDKKTIPVNTENFQTNKEGIFAIGDICTYPGKLKLILSGFHEGALAARACFKLAKPNEKYRFEFSTTSKNIQEKLGIKKSD
ncbi:MAG: NAD(P)/FAD-dependent oxidoreductase [Candidatus Pelagibacterales bacterium]|nr:MAG: NAD(P)/FAD-dependent oxidoreductase [Pelagibacterales bacterium]